MAAVTVYGPPISTAVSRVLFCLLEKDVTFELAAVDMAKGQHKSPEFLKLQPFGKVPAFKDQNITLFESRAICRYICDKYADQGHKPLHGRTLHRRALVEQWLEAEAQNFDPPSSALVFQLAFAPRMGRKQDQKLIDESEAKLGKVLDVYEQRLGESRFLAGDEFTLADLSHVPNGNFVFDRDNLIKARRNVGRWWEEISSRDSWKKVVEMQRKIG